MADTECAPAVYQIPEDLPANVAWRLASMYRLRPGDAIVFQPLDELPFSGVTHYQPERAPELASVLPFLDHKSGPAYHEYVTGSASLQVSSGGGKAARGRKRKPKLGAVR